MSESISIIVDDIPVLVDKRRFEENPEEVYWVVRQNRESVTKKNGDEETLRTMEI
jgi:hypothetical protein